MSTKVTPLPGIAPERKVNQLTTWDRSQLFLGVNWPRWNPDALVTRKGLKIYGRMLDDEQVKAVMNFKRDAVLARGFGFGFGKDCKLPPEQRKDRIAVMMRICEAMRGSFQDGLNTIAMGRAYGYSLTEKVLGEVEYDGKTWIGINQLIGRDVCDFEIFTDDYGRLQKVEQTISGKRQKINMDAMIHYVQAPEFDRYYGRSDLREAYRPWYIKDVVMRMWPMYLERFGGGFAIAKRTDQSSIVFGTPEFTSLQDALSDIKSNTHVILPPGVELEMHFPTTTDGYEKAISFFDLAIAKALLVPNLLGVSHTGKTGAFAQSQTQLEAFIWTLMGDGKRIESCLNEQLFKEIGDRNWGDNEYPRFKLKTPSEDHLKWTLAMWRDLVKEQAVMPTQDDEALIRELLEMPERDEDSPSVKEEHLAMELEYEPEPAPVAAPPVKNASDENLVERVSVAVMAAIAPVLALAKPKEEPSLKPAQNSRAAAFSRAEARVHFSVLEQQSEVIVAETAADCGAIIAKATVRALGTPENQQGLITPEGVAGVQFSGNDISKVKGRCLEALAKGWQLGHEMALNELDRARGVRATREQFASLRDNAADYFAASAFKMAGNLSDGAKAIIQQELQNAIKYGYSVETTRTHIWERLLGRGFVTAEGVRGVEADEEVLDGLAEYLADPKQPAYLSTLIRTNTFEAYNEARYALYTDPDLAEFVRALEYSAFLDARTTELCRSLNGMTFAADSKVWDSYRPPNHYNCRSVLIAITALDGWDGQESPLPGVAPQKGFGGEL